MACETYYKPRQTQAQRVEEVKKAVLKMDRRISSGQARVKVGPQGGIVIDGIPIDERDGVTDACAYHKLMVYGSALTKTKIAQAEQIAGRRISKEALAQGFHSHDGGRTWQTH